MATRDLSHLMKLSAPMPKFNSSSFALPVFLHPSKEVAHSPSRVREANLTTASSLAHAGAASFESSKVIENEHQTNANQVEARVAQDFLAPAAATRPDACI
jgi:hypothetical protein